MKKILALVLVLMLSLAAVSAFAAGSKDINDTQQAVVNPAAPAAAALSLEIIEDTAEAKQLFEKFQKAYEEGDVLKVFPEEVRKQIPEGLTKINEMVTAKWNGDTTKATGDLKVNIIFKSQYEPKDEEVAVMVGKLENGDVTWTMFKGVTKDDGSIDVIFSKDTIQELKNNPFVIVVVSK